MPSFNVSNLTSVFSGSKAKKIQAWFGELRKDNQSIAECFESDEIPLKEMQPLLEEVLLLYPAHNALESIRQAIVAIRGKLKLDLGEPDAVILRGEQANIADLDGLAFVHIRERVLPDSVIQRAAGRLGKAFISDCDKTVLPMDWCRYCTRLGANPLGNWRGFAWLAPLDDVQSEIRKHKAHAKNSYYWYYRHWLYVGLPWHFTALKSVNAVLKALDAQQLFAVLWIDGAEVDHLNVPSVPDAFPGADPSEYFFRPRGWWRSKGNKTGTGVSLDLLGNLDGQKAIPGAREVVGGVKGNIGAIRELLPQQDGRFTLLKEVSLV